MVIISWIQIFKFFGFELDAANKILQLVRSSDNNKWKIAFYCIINAILIVMPFSAKVVSYYMLKYVYGHILGYMNNRKMNKTLIELGLKPVSYWLVFKIMVKNQIMVLFDTNPYRKLNISLRALFFI